MFQSADQILQQLDAVISSYDDVRGRSKYDDLSDLKGEVSSEANARMQATIKRLAPQGSPHLIAADAIMKQYGIGNGYSIALLLGILRAMRADYAAGYLSSVAELIHADLFADFLEMSEHLLSQGYKDPSAVVIGSVLEEHLRKLCDKAGITAVTGTAPKKADLLNADLAGAGVYSKLDQKSVTAWLDLRNKAAHGKYSEYTKEQVQALQDGVRHFISRYPA
jgi:hypothetical protein